MLKFVIVIKFVIILFLFYKIYDINLTNIASHITKNRIINRLSDNLKIIQSKKKEDKFSVLLKCIGGNYDMSESEMIRLKYLFNHYHKLLEENNIPHSIVWYIALKENRFRLNHKNGMGSSANGMFGFIDETWESMCKKGGYDINGRYNEEKQVKIMVIYLNTLYNKYGSWDKVLNEYHGGRYQYPVNFLFK